MGAVDRQPRSIPGGKFGCHALDFKMGIDRQATEPITLNRKSRGQWMGLHAGAPDHCRGGDAFTRRERGAFFIDIGYRNSEARLYSERLERLCDDRPGALAHVGADPRLPIGEDHPRGRRGIGRGDCRAEFAKHLRSDLDAGEAAANDKDIILASRILASRGLAVRQHGNVIVKPRAGLVGIDVQSVRLQAGDGRPDEAAAKSEDEPVV